MNKKLEKLGLNESESKIYLKLLGLGSCKAGIIAKEVKYNRTTIYKSLDSLIKKGLVSYVIKENRKYFEAANPENLKENLKKEKLELEKKNKLANEMLPSLKELYNDSKSEQEANIYKGIKGLKAIFNDILSTLKSGDEYFCFGVPKNAEQFWGYFDEFNKILKKNKVKSKIIFDERVKKNIDSCQKYGYQVKILSQEHFTPAEVNIYKNKVAIVLWSKNPIGFLIKDKETANSFRTYFNLMWNIAKK
ncbi:MAG: helix-turn-helix domain-containing protein [Nanoarchaeota archaeon]|nr:helix-turn-helix domain-containing protein [Nanoarchaeota archaeon]MBU1322153.1 helix-turn-helix domain-containing protein [Nanoarchaeota archaeon]MBU1597874.1 helix-turn-helix domain-containing protein [Nanoarchaeota archaeon]MBU2441293.1 helix-turn-helix domain-containing protein [Nanoarchaeota archaeon]